MTMFSVSIHNTFDFLSDFLMILIKSLYQNWVKLTHVYEVYWTELMKIGDLSFILFTPCRKKEQGPASENPQNKAHHTRRKKVTSKTMFSASAASSLAALANLSAWHSASHIIIYLVSSINGIYFRLALVLY